MATLGRLLVRFVVRFRCVRKNVYASAGRLCTLGYVQCGKHLHPLVWVLKMKHLRWGVCLGRYKLERVRSG